LHANIIKLKIMKIGIIGFGRVGSSLFDFLEEKNLIVSPYSKSKRIGDFKRVILDSEIIFICVKDDLIPERVRKIDKLEINNKKHFIHLSGATPLPLLDPLKRKGHYTGKLHPIQSFSERNKEAFKNIYATFSGDKETLNILKDIFGKDLKIIELKEREQLLIHIACVFASNFPVYSIIKAEEILEKLNLEREILNPLIKTSIYNVIEKGAKNSLTGPAKRRDIRTIRVHKKILKNFKKDIYSIYNYLTKKILDERGL